MRGRIPSPERRERTDLLAVHSVEEGPQGEAVLVGVVVGEEEGRMDVGAEGDHSDVVTAEVEAEEAGEEMEEGGVVEEEVVLLAQEAEEKVDIN